MNPDGTFRSRHCTATILLHPNPYGSSFERTEPVANWYQAPWSRDRTSGRPTRKSRNLTENAACVIAVKLPDIDLVVEGFATKVTDRSTLERLAERYNAEGWPAVVEDGAFTAPYSAPSAGRAPWDLYEFVPTTAFGVATAEPHGATRWRFDT